MKTKCLVLVNNNTKGQLNKKMITFFLLLFLFVFLQIWVTETQKKDILTNLIIVFVHFLTIKEEEVSGLEQH